MIIFGIGTDIVSIDRIKSSMKNKNFIKRIFDKKEILKCRKIKKNINCLAKRFAAKEAFSKALGTGISNGINFNEIVVLNKKSGKPYLSLTGKTKKIFNTKLEEKKLKSHYLSLMKNFAVAFVTISIWIIKNYIHNLW